MISIRCSYSIKYLLVSTFCAVITNELLKILLLVEHQNLHNVYLNDSKVISSIWCDNDYGNIKHKICMFENLCWLPKEEQFVFFMDEESIVSGVDYWHEFSKLDFSSVEGHNRFLLKLNVITNTREENHPLWLYHIHEEKEWVYFLWRFKPDNIMHILHDDLLPLYYTYMRICGGDVEKCINNYKLIFMDDVISNHSLDLYAYFSKGGSKLGVNGPSFLRDNWKAHNNTLICFKHARIGLSRSTTWFQYGFGKPQGAIENSNLTALTLKRFGHFLIRRLELHVPASSCKEKPQQKALFLTRNISRKILNEEDLIKTTKNVYLKEVGSTLDVKYSNPFSLSALSEIKEILKIVTDFPPVTFIFGMHGAALTVASLLSLATNIGCIPLTIMELFPMGIDPEAVSPIKALTKLPWLQNKLFYESWTNKDPLNSQLPSTNLHPLQGGGSKCQGMDLRSPIKAVHCCHSEEYICRMFQDTIVDLKKEYLTSLSLLFRNLKEFKLDVMVTNNQEWKWYFPAPVYNISCIWNLKFSFLKLLWKKPINIHEQEHHYDATLTLETEKVIREDDNLKGNADSSLNKFQGVSYQKKDYFFKVFEPYILVNIPEEFARMPSKILKAMIWIQSVVTLKCKDKTNHRKSLDTFYSCSVAT